MSRIQKRHVNGVLILDKPEGMTSNKALQQVKWMLRAKKAGHTGSLDPLATGVLPLCFGEATKFSRYLLEADKTYVVTARLGERTDTADAEGRVVESRPVPPIDDDALQACLERFRGEQLQTPPMYSALKKDGQPLYVLARQGQEVERKPRQVTISRLELLAKRNDELELRVSCTKGTYIRSLVEDIGDDLGCLAHVKTLRREQAGPFTLPESVSLDTVRARFEAGGEAAIEPLLLPPGTGLPDWPEIELCSEDAQSIKHGKVLQDQRFDATVDAPWCGARGMVKLCESKAQARVFFGLGEVKSAGDLVAVRLMSTQGVD